MSKKTLITLSIIIFGTNLIFANGDSGADQKKADEMATKLQTAEKAEDSIKILYDVYDLSDRDKKKDVGFQILNIAERTNNRDVTVDILSRLASRVEDTEALGRLLEISTKLPEDSTRRGVELVIAMERVKNEANNMDSWEREKKLLEYAQKDMRDKTDIYEEILDLYSAMVYLGTSSQGSLYLEYITRLQDLVKRLPENDFAIRNLVYTTAAIYYTRKQNYSDALAASHELLNQVEKLKEKFPPSERKYQTFDYFTYMVYRRMLENYKGMSRDEAKWLYDQCVDIASRNEEVDSIFGKRGLTKTYYYMAMHDYKNAIPHIRQALSNDNLSLFRKQELLGHLVEALDSVGDRAALFDAMKEYIGVMEDYKKERTNDAYNELRVRRDVNKLAYEERMEAQQNKVENQRMRKISITLVYLLAVALILMCSNYFRMRQKVKELKKQNKGLNRNLEQIFDDGGPRGAHDIRIHRGKLKG